MSRADLWTLDPAVDFLNHGSFGACPREVLAEQSRLRERLEAEPVRFLVREVPELLEAARAKLAEFLGADPAALVFVPNATTAVNAVLRSSSFGCDDELLFTNHGYNACRNVLAHVAERSGARVVVAELPEAPGSSAELAEAVMARVGPRTRFALLDHVTSPTALVLPIAELVADLESRGVTVLVDGAHAPGMLPLALDELGASYYAGNLHKWVCAPKGAAFLHAREDRRDLIRPAVISHGANAPLGDRSRYHVEFDWTGTSDPTPWLSVPAALEVMGRAHPDGWAGLRRRNRSLALEARTILAASLEDAPLPAPETLGSMATLRLPDAPPEEALGPFDTAPLQDRLFREHGIEVPVFPFPTPTGRRLRISVQLYNDLDQYRRLARALETIIGDR